ncbi:MAG: hypothetical protein ACOY0R_02135 [Chloroflexota bacterium]
MKPGVWIAALAFSLGLAGCNAPADRLPTPTSTPSPAPTPTVSMTSSATPTETPTVTPRTPSVYVTAREHPVNCRYGPGVYYAIVDRLEPYQSAQVEGQDESGNWWYLRNPNFPGAFCWAAASATDLDGDADTVPVNPPPRVTVSKVEARAEPPRITVGCDAFPQYLLVVAEVSVNGPTLVDWRWELSTGEHTTETALVFTEAGTQTVQKSLVIYTPNNYWALLRILSPNELNVQVDFVANCIP